MAELQCWAAATRAFHGSVEIIGQEFLFRVCKTRDGLLVGQPWGRGLDDWYAAPDDVRALSAEERFFISTFQSEGGTVRSLTEGERAEAHLHARSLIGAEA